MPQVINTNVMSLNAQRQLNKSQLESNQAMERLASGLRINSAKDDAAGLGISTGMMSQIRGINQAVRNAGDGISMAQTAEGAMDEMTNILQRMRELSVQAANDTNSASNRASIQEEVDQLYNELDRIAGVTQFNGINLLDGSGGAANLQIGANTGESLSFTIDAVTTTDLNLNAVSGVGDLNGGRVSTSITMGTNTTTINGVTIDATEFAAAVSGDAAETMATALNKKTGLTGVQASAYNIVEGNAGGTGVLALGDLIVNGTTVSAAGSKQEIVDNINRDVSDVIAKLSSDGSIELSNDTGKTITITGTAASNAGLVTDTYQGYVSLSSVGGDEIEIGLTSVGTADDLFAIGFNVSEGSDKVTGAAISTSITVPGASNVTTSEITASDGIQINGVDLGAVTGTSAADKAFAINAISDQTGVNATATTEVTFSADITAFATGFTINGVNITTLAGNTDLDTSITEINSSGLQGVIASSSAEGFLVLTSSSGQDIRIEADANNLNLVLGGTPSGAIASDQTFKGAITLEGQDGKDVIVTSTAAAQSDAELGLAKLGLTDQGGNETAVGIGLSVTSVQNAEFSIERIDEALEKISGARGRLGAIQNRLGSTISNLENVSQNLSAANSRIRDADFAMETSKLSKTQILQQAGTSMLAQANASSQSVLSLLG
jgi:flagellin